MSTSSTVKATAALVTLVYLVVFIRNGLPVGEVLAPYGAAVSAVTLAWLVFDRWLWRLPFVREHVAHRPLLHGTWRGTLTPQSEDPTTGESWPSDDDVYLVITQDYSTIHARLHTRNGSSQTISTKLERAADGAYEVYSVYRFDPQLGGRDGNPMHNGTLKLNVADGVSPRLVGEYWTDRETIGRLELTEHSPRRARGRADAASLFANRPVA